MGQSWGLWGQDLSHTCTKKFLTPISSYLGFIYTPWTSELYDTWQKSKNNTRIWKNFACSYVLGGATLNKHIWPCQTLTNLIFGQHATFTIILQKKVVSIPPKTSQGENEYMYCGYYCMSPFKDHFITKCDKREVKKLDKQSLPHKGNSSRTY